MATYTAHDKDQIVFETIADERAPGLLFLLHGAAFAGGPLYALVLYGVKDPSAWLLLVLIILAGLAEIGYALNLLLKSEWLVIDLRRRSYTGRRGVLFWGGRWAGPLEDFDHIRLRDRPCGRHGRHRRWVVEWVWGEPERRPFRISGWDRQKSFGLTPRPRASESLEFLRKLRAIAEDTGLPLVIPKPCLDDLGVGDLELDTLPDHSGLQ